MWWSEIGDDLSAGQLKKECTLLIVSHDLRELTPLVRRHACSASFLTRRRRIAESTLCCRWTTRGRCSQAGFCTLHPGHQPATANSLRHCDWKLPALCVNLRPLNPTNNLQVLGKLNTEAADCVALGQHLDPCEATVKATACCHRVASGALDAVLCTALLRHDVPQPLTCFWVGC